jgi:hypothetical protein
MPTTDATKRTRKRYHALSHDLRKIMCAGHGVTKDGYDVSPVATVDGIHWVVVFEGETEAWMPSPIEACEWVERDRRENA